MTKQASTSHGSDLPLAAALLVGLISAIVVGLSFYVIRYWPIPASVAPYMGFTGGFWWGLIIGGISGWVLGFLVDDSHFKDSAP
jgi:hypothetical protein